MDQVYEPITPNSLLAHAPGNPILWQQFLALLTRLLDCHSGFMLVTDLVERENTRFLYSFNLSYDYRRQYESRLNKLDVFNHFISKNPRQAYCNQALGPNYREEIKNNPLTNVNLTHRFGVSVPCNHRHALSLLINRDKRFSKQEQRHGVKTLQTLLPTLEDSIHAEKRHKINSQLFHYLGSRFDAYLIVDRDLNVLFVDPVDSRIINTMDCVNISGDKFAVNNPAIEQRLMHLIAAKQDKVSFRNQCLSCQITLIPIDSLENLYHWECHKEGIILAFTHDKDSNSAIERLMEIYTLSKCEAICALHFMQNPSIPDVAASTCRSQETVRNHLKRSMQKMGVHNQAALMKKLMTLSSL